MKYKNPAGRKLHGFFKLGLGLLDIYLFVQIVSHTTLNKKHVVYKAEEGLN